LVTVDHDRYQSSNSLLCVTLAQGFCGREIECYI
jgi:hypothetical protein